MLPQIVATLEKKSMLYLKQLYQSRPERAVAVINEDPISIDEKLTAQLHGELAQIGYRRIPSNYHGKSVRQLDEIAGDAVVLANPFSLEAMFTDDPWNEVDEERLLFLHFLILVGEVTPSPRSMEMRRLLQDFTAETLPQDYDDLWERFEKAASPTARKNPDRPAYVAAQERMYWKDVPEEVVDHSTGGYAGGGTKVVFAVPQGNFLSDLRDLLASLYQDEASIRRVLSDARINASNIRLNSSGQNNWHSVLTEADNIGLVGNILVVARGTYAFRIDQLLAKYGLTLM